MSDPKLFSTRVIDATPDPTGLYNRYDGYLAVYPGDPLHMVGVCRRFNGPGANYQDTLEVQYTVDGGVSWNTVPLTLDPGYYSISDPWIGIDVNGNAYVIAGATMGTARSQSEQAVCCYVSNDKGATWSSANYIVTGTHLDQTFGGIDQASGRVYAIWTTGYGNGPLNFAISLDGVNWSPSPNFSPPNPSNPFALTTSGFSFLNMSVGPDGSIHIIGLGVSSAINTMSYARSLDGGATFLVGVIAANQPAPGTDTIFGLQTGTPDLAVENPPTIFAAGNGVVLAAWNTNTAAPNSTSPSTVRIALASCTDNGAGWASSTTSTAPQTIPLLPLGGLSNTPSDQYFSPRFAVMPNGTVGCLCVYVQVLAPNGMILPGNMSFALVASFADSAQQFFSPGYTSAALVSGPPTNPIPANNPVLRWGVATEYFIGDFVGLAATAFGFFPYWSDPRSGSAQLFCCNVRVLAALDESLGPIWMAKDLNTVWPGFSAMGPITAADVDGDGEVELVLTRNVNLETAVMKWQRGQLSTVWSSGAVIAGRAGNWNRSNVDVMTAADVDGDGEVEIVIANNSDQWTGVLKWQSGMLQVIWMSPTPLVGPAGSWFRGADVFVAADLDGDGVDELLVANFSDNWMGVLDWQGGALVPIWIATNALGPSEASWSALAADVDGDGASEILLTSSAVLGGGVRTGLLKWQQGQLNLIWASSSALTGPAGDWIRNGADSLTAADLDGDGIAEIVIANNGDKWTGVLKWQGGALIVLWMSPNPLAGPAGDWMRGPDIFTAADVDGDGADEIVIANNSNGWTGVLKWSGGALAPVCMSANPLNGPAGSWDRGADTFTAADVDAGGADEVFVANAVDNWIGVLATGAG